MAVGIAFVGLRKKQNGMLSEWRSQTVGGGQIGGGRSGLIFQ
jgi:hypothetical protein